MALPGKSPEREANERDEAGEIYGSSTLAASIEDHARNFTRFILAAPRESALRPLDGPARRWKPRSCLRVANKPGALFGALGAFGLRDIDLSKIESRPIKGMPWEYTFYVYLIGNAAEEPLAGALENLRDIAEPVKVLGSYPTRW